DPHVSCGRFDLRERVGAFRADGVAARARRLDDQRADDLRELLDVGYRFIARGARLEVLMQRLVLGGLELAGAHRIDAGENGSTPHTRLLSFPERPAAASANGTLCRAGRLRSRPRSGRCRRTTSPP